MRYGIGSFLFLLALAARFALTQVLPAQGFPFLTFFPAVLLTAYVAGLGPGLFTSLLSILAAWFFFIEPVYSFAGLAFPDAVAVAFFSAILVIDCLVIDVMNRALSDVRHAGQRLRDSETQLRRALAELQEAGQQKDAFLATLAHELRNPLAPIRSAAHLIRLRNVPDEAVRKAAAVVDRQSAHLTRLVDDLLDVSRITFGNLQLQRGELDLRQAIASAVETCRPQMDAAGHELVTRLPDEPLMVDVDETRVAQSVANLLSNAAKFTPAPGRIWLEVGVAEPGWASVKVRDNGQGIAHAMLDKVFERFTQERRAGLAGNSGLGIGLALTRQLIELQGGRVLGRSEGVGRGAEFEVLLPLLAPPASAAA